MDLNQTSSPEAGEEPRMDPKMLLDKIEFFTEARQKVGYASAVASRFGSTIHILIVKIFCVRCRDRTDDLRA